MSARTRAMFRRLTGGFRRRFVVGLLASVLGALGLIQACTSENISGVQIGAVSVTPSARTIVVGETASFDATVTDDNGATLSGAGVTWSIAADDQGIASIDASGEVTGLAVGSAQVLATFQGRSDEATLTVLPAPTLSVTPGSADFYAGAGGPDPDPVALTVENAGAGTIEGLSAEIVYPEGEETNWLAVELSSATTPTELEMAATGAGLGPGRFTATVTLTTSDPDDPPYVVPVTFVRSSFTVTSPAEGVVVNEGGDEATFSVVLDVAPESDVVLDVASADESEVTVSPEQLTFTPENWDTGQTVTVRGVDDASQDGNQGVTVTISVDPDASDLAYGPALDRSVAVTNVDDDQVGFTITETNGETVVDESGSTDTLLVRLSSRPGNDVYLTVVASDAGEASVSPQTLVFTASSWNAPQPVTVQGEDDDLVDGAQVGAVTIQVDEARSDDAFAGLEPQAVQVTTLDDDGAGIRVNPGTLTVNEGGSTQAFTIILEAEPTATVTLAVTSGDPGEATLDRATLVFTPSNYDDAQTVLVTGVDDDLVDGDQVTAVNVVVVAGSSAPEYADAAPASVSVTTLDDDAAALAVTQSSGGTAVSEAGTSDTIRVALTAEPVDDVVLTVASANVSEVTVSPTSLTFTATNWDATQNVIVTGVDDAAADGNQTIDISISVDAAQSDASFQGVSPVVVPVTNADDDQPGFSVTSGSTVSVSEAGGTADVTVVLNTQPASDVVLSLALSGGGVVTLGASQLTFTSSTWDTPQSVTLTGIDDDIDDGDQQATLTISVDDAASDDDYDGVADQTITVTAVDDDVVGITLSPETLSVSESGTIATFTVVLNSEPAVGEVVVLDVASLDAGEATASPARLTFTRSGGADPWNVPQTVSVTGEDDDLVDGDQSTRVVVIVDEAGSDPDYAGESSSVTVTTTDDDEASLVLSTTTVTAVEGGAAGTFTVALGAQPSGAVTFSVVSGTPAQATVSPATLTFDGTTWADPQTVTVTAVDDPAADGDVSLEVTLGVTSSADAAFAEVTGTVTATAEDNEVAGLVLGGGPVAVTEGGVTDELTVRLSSQPTADVTVAFAFDADGQITLSDTTLTFDATTWNQDQVVTVSAFDDFVAEPEQVVGLTLSVQTGDATYLAVADEVTSATVTDDDVAGLVLEGGPVAVTEGGATDELTVRLSSRPTAPVTLRFAFDVPGQVALSDTTLTVTPGSWNQNRTVTVSAVNDLVAEPEQVVGLTLSVETGDATYLAVADEVTSATVTDDDVAGLTMTSASALAVSEDGNVVDGFSVELDAEPRANVVLTVTSEDEGEVSVLPSSLTFTPEDWSTPQTVDLSGEVDGIVDGPQETDILVAVDDALSDDLWDLIADTVSVTTTDDNEPGLTLGETEGNTLVAEAGATDTVTVALAAEPVGTVTLNLTSDPADQITLSQSTLTFDATTWNVADTIIVLAVDDGLPEVAEHTVDLILTVAAGSDEQWLGFADTLTVTIQDAVEEFVEARVPSASGPSRVPLAPLAVPLREPEAALAGSR